MISHKKMHSLARDLSLLVLNDRIEKVKHFKNLTSSEKDNILRLADYYERGQND